MSLENKHEYSIAWLEKGINAVINFIFSFRLVLICIALYLLGRITYHVWSVSPDTEKFKNLSLVCGLGSVAIGIFYSILNYENNHIKTKADARKAKLTLSFSNVADWHKPTMVENLKITKKIYDAHKHLMDDNRGKEFFEILEKDENSRSALVSILNYFECISLAVKMELLDGEYLKEAIGDVARIYVNAYGPYITYRRAAHMVPDMWIHFTNWVASWDKK